ncbi:MAG: uracil phosphoribosyltransferase [Bacteroidota bacterium]
MLTLVDHPILKRDIAILRDKATPHGLFRVTLADAASILAYEALRGVPLAEVDIETPLETTVGHVLAKEVVVVPVLRAGLGMADGFVRFVPEARIGHLGMYRDEATHEPVDYYANIPAAVTNAVVFVVDPMLATGGSAAGAIGHLKKQGATDVRLVVLVAAPEGVAHIEAEHPDVPITAAVLDRELDGHAYIRPGLGDAGDRIFGT